MKVPISDFMSIFTLEFQKQKDCQKIFHFAVRQRPEFEALRGSILRYHPLPTITESVAELLIGH